MKSKRYVVCVVFIGAVFSLSGCGKSGREDAKVSTQPVQKIVKKIVVVDADTPTSSKNRSVRNVDSNESVKKESIQTCLDLGLITENDCGMCSELGELTCSLVQDAKGDESCYECRDVLVSCHTFGLLENSECGICSEIENSECIKSEEYAKQSCFECAVIQEEVKIEPMVDMSVDELIPIVDMIENQSLEVLVEESEVIVQEELVEVIVEDVDEILSEDIIVQNRQVLEEKDVLVEENVSAPVVVQSIEKVEKIEIVAVELNQCADINQQSMSDCQERCPGICENSVTLDNGVSCYQCQVSPGSHVCSSEGYFNDCKSCSIDQSCRKTSLILYYPGKNEQSPMMSCYECVGDSLKYKI